MWGNELRAVSMGFGGWSIIFMCFLPPFGAGNQEPTLRMTCFYGILWTLARARLRLGCGVNGVSLGSPKRSVNVPSILSQMTHAIYIWPMVVVLQVHVPNYLHYRSIHELFSA